MYRSRSLLQSYWLNFTQSIRKQNTGTSLFVEMLTTLILKVTAKVKGEVEGYCNVRRIRYDMRRYFNVRLSQLNLPHGTNN